MKEYVLEVLGLKRTLPVTKTPSGLYIAGFNPVGDMEVLLKAAANLVEQLAEAGIKFDVILTTELKGLPIAQEVSRLAGVDYVCLRKEAKCYMLNPRQTDGESITSGKSSYFISETDENKLIGKNVLFVDDVFSLGLTFRSALKYAGRAGFKIVASANILKEGALGEEKKSGFLFEGVPVFYCGFLPLQSGE